VQLGPGNSFALQCFGMLAIFFDTRSFKNKKKDHYLGPHQLNWIKKILSLNELPVMLISTQQFWSYRFLAESYQETSEHEFEQLMALLKQLKQNLFFISGDVHYSQLQKVPYDILKSQTFEVTSSAFFSSSARSFGKRSVDEGQVFYYGHPNFITLEQIQNSNTELAMNVCCHTEEKINFYIERIQIKK
jgi:phosphodiesterase/alkaline phosphatase D-like protein